MIIQERYNKPILFCCIVCVFTLIYLFSPVYQITDSKYLLLLTDRIIHDKSFTFDPEVVCAKKVVSKKIQYECSPLIYEINDNYYYAFNIATPVLSIPFVLLFDQAGISVVNNDGSYNIKNEVILQRCIAGFLMALLVGILFLIAAEFSGTTVAFSAAALFGLGTPIWSTASRGLWAHTFGILFLSLALLIIIRNEYHKSKEHPVVLASLLSWIFFIRPTFSISIIAISIFIIIKRRKILLPFMVTGMVWLILYILFLIFIYQQPVPYYSGTASMFNRYTFPEAFPGNLFSPGRGFFIYLPFSLIVFYIITTNFKSYQNKLIISIALLVMLFHLIIVSFFGHWWTGHSYGPRVMTDILPWLYLLYIISIQTYLSLKSDNRRKKILLGCIGCILMIISIGIHARGALSKNTWLWNIYPTNIDSQPSRLWDWRDPQFLGLPRKIPQGIQ
jgi:hypothetical protein